MRPGSIHRPAVRPRPVRSSIGITAVRITAVRVPAVRAAWGTATRPWPLRSAVAGTAVRRHARREPAGLSLLAGLSRLTVLSLLAGLSRLTMLSLLARVGPPGLAGPRRTGRRLARAAQQLPVVVFVEIGRPARPGRIVLLGRGRVTLVGGVGSRTVVTAISLASRQTVRVTAEAGVATFHQIPPGPLLASHDAGRLPLPLECRSIEIPCMT
jgi:hypothetical protein